MDIIDALDMKDDLLSSAVRLPRLVETEFTLSGVKAEKAVSRIRLLFIRMQAYSIPVIRNSTLHVLDKEYDAPEIHTTFLEYPVFLT